MAEGLKKKVAENIADDREQALRVGVRLFAKAKARNKEALAAVLPSQEELRGMNAAALEATFSQLGVTPEQVEQASAGDYRFCFGYCD